MTKGEFKALLFRSAIQRARQLNFTFTGVAGTDIQTDIQTFISQGVERMTTQDLNDQTRMTLAERNLTGLIERMASEARKRNLNESLDYRTFSDARMVICPLWPFC